MEKGAWNREKKEEKQDVEKNSYIFFANVTRKTWPIDKARKMVIFHSIWRFKV